MKAIVLGLIAGALLPSMLGCSTAPQGAAFSPCPEIYVMKGSMEETALIHDVRSLRQTTGVAAVTDYADGGTAYLRVTIHSGYDLDVREKVAELGWTRVEVIPQSAKPVVVLH
jgi:hypothetical protein